MDVLRFGPEPSNGVNDVPSVVLAKLLMLLDGTNVSGEFSVRITLESCCRVMIFQVAASTSVTFHCRSESPRCWLWRSMVYCARGKFAVINSTLMTLANLMSSREQSLTYCRAAIRSPHAAVPPCCCLILLPFGHDAFLSVRRVLVNARSSKVLVPAVHAQPR